MYIVVPKSDKVITDILQNAIGLLCSCCNDIIIKWLAKLEVAYIVRMVRKFFPCSFQVENSFNYFQLKGVEFSSVDSKEV